MASKEIKLRNLNGYLKTLIEVCHETISDAIVEMEKFNITPIDFRKESTNLNVSAFILSYLNRIKEISEKSDYKTTADFIRFHKYQLETKAIGNDNAVEIAHKKTISVLSSIIHLYLDK